MKILILSLILLSAKRSFAANSDIKVFGGPRVGSASSLKHYAFYIGGVSRPIYLNFIDGPTEKFYFRANENYVFDIKSNKVTKVDKLLGVLGKIDADSRYIENWIPYGTASIYTKIFDGTGKELCTNTYSHFYWPIVPTVLSNEGMTAHTFRYQPPYEKNGYPYRNDSICVGSLDLNTCKEKFVPLPIRSSTPDGIWGHHTFHSVFIDSNNENLYYSYGNLKVATYRYNFASQTETKLVTGTPYNKDYNGFTVSDSTLAESSNYRGILLRHNHGMPIDSNFKFNGFNGYVLYDYETGKFREISCPLPEGKWCGDVKIGENADDDLLALISPVPMPPKYERSFHLYKLGKDLQVKGLEVSIDSSLLPPDQSIEFVSSLRLPGKKQSQWWLETDSTYAFISQSTGKSSLPKTFRSVLIFDKATHSLKASSDLVRMLDFTWADNKNSARDRFIPGTKINFDRTPTLNSEKNTLYILGYGITGVDIKNAQIVEQYVNRDVSKSGPIENEAFYSLIWKGQSLFLLKQMPQGTGYVDQPSVELFEK